MLLAVAEEVAVALMVEGMELDNRDHHTRSRNRANDIYENENIEHVQFLVLDLVAHVSQVLDDNRVEL